MIPVFLEFEKAKVDMFSLTMFLASYVAEMLAEMDDKDKKEVILRKMLD